MNLYALLADLVAAIHLGYVSFVVLGLLVILTGRLLRWRFVKNFWFRIVHLAMILIVVVEALLGIVCPLTVWEYDLRVAANQQNISDGSFVARLVHQVMFFNFPPIVFLVGYCLFGLAVLLSWWLIPPVFPWKKQSTAESLEEQS
jgi:hypothetical protein